MTIPSLCFIVLVVSFVTGQDPIVRTQYGQLRGNRKNERGIQWEEFLGIPFVAPRVNETRFTKPVPPESWRGVRPAQQYSSHCIQIVGELYFLLGMTDTMSEDCLYLNVWVPNQVRRNASLPVMVFYFGGGYVIGTAEMYRGYDLAVQGNVIVVGFNSRVAALGFAGTGDDVARGNYGLWDGHAALTWVRDNIRNFGGDPNKITIFGLSAGGGGVTHTLVSPVTRGMAQRGICQSGTGLYSGMDASDIREGTEAIADWLGCPTNDSTEMIACLREEDAVDVDLFGLIGPILAGSPGATRPNIDGEFILRQPIQDIRQGALRDIDWMVGSTYHDSSVGVTGNLLALNYSLDIGIETVEETEQSIRDMLVGLPDEEAAYEEVLRMYPGVTSETKDVRADVYSRMLTERGFALGAHEATVVNSQAVPKRTYQYTYQHRQSFFMYPAWVNASHIDDMYSTFGESFFEEFRQNFLNGEWTEEDRRAFRYMATYWGNFAHNGNPNEGVAVPADWGTYNTSTRMYAHLTAHMNSGSVKPESDELVQRYNFWLSVRDGQDIDMEIPDESWPSVDIKSPDEYTLEEVQDVVEKVIIKTLKIPEELYIEASQAIMDKVEESYYRAKERREYNKVTWQ